jgi:nucleoside-diphosphate-sugar epimerase
MVGQPSLMPLPLERTTLNQARGAFPRKVIITGGNGYVGSELIRQLLAQGVEVHAIANNHTERLSGLLPSTSIHAISSDFAAVASLVQQIRPDAILHLAAVHAEPPTFDEMMGMLNCSLLLGVALLHGAQACDNRPVFIHAGTYWQFDDGVYAPNTFYSAAKQALHDLLMYYRRVHSMRSVTLVLYDIFGPNDTRPKLWSNIRHAPAGSTFPTSEGRQYIELVHVSDVAHAFVYATSLLLEDSPLGPLHAIRSGVHITLRQLLEQVKQRIGLDLNFEWGVIPYWPGQIFEPWQGPVLPGWQPTIDPVNGIADLLASLPIAQDAKKDESATGEKI